MCIKYWNHIPFTDHHDHSAHTGVEIRDVNDCNGQCQNGFDHF